MTRVPLLAVLLLCAAAAAARAAETVVVLSGDQPVYQEALEGFRGAFGQPFDLRVAGSGRPLPEETRVVVAIGGRAALESYPPQVALVYCLAPGLRLAPSQEGPVAEVGMLPAPRRLLARLRRRRPGLRRLGVLWSARSFSAYVRLLEREAVQAGLAVIGMRVDGDAELWKALRELHADARVDALWIPPDPAFAAPSRLEALRGATAQWKLPYYGATPGFLRYGAADTVGAGFADVGRGAALAARQALEGRLSRRYFPAEDASAAAQEGR